MALTRGAADPLPPLAEFNVKEIRPPRMDDSGRTKYPVLFRVYVPYFVCLAFGAHALPLLAPIHSLYPALTLLARAHQTLLPPPSRRAWPIYVIYLHTRRRLRLPFPRASVK